MDTTLTNSSTISSEPRQTIRPRRVRNAVSLALCIAAAAALLFFVDRLLMPKYMSGIYEGALVAEYYASEKNHELLILGDCEVYENISPVTLWEDYGVTSYIRGSPQQLIWHSYYLLEDTLRYEKPKAVVFNVLAMKFDEPQSEAYNRLAIDGMRMSGSKIAAAKASMTEGESLISYLFPLLRYHERWKSLSTDDFNYLLSARGVSFNGFMMRTDVKPLNKLPTPPKLSDYELGAVCWEYLDKMRTLCEKNGIEFILVKAPAPFPHWYDEWEAQITSYARQHGLLYINGLDAMDEIGIDMNTDTYDAGLHLNLDGAEKFSKYLGGIINRHCGLNDYRSDSSVSAVWENMKDDYYRLKETQTSEIALTGKVTTLTRE